MVNYPNRGTGIRHHQATVRKDGRNGPMEVRTYVEPCELVELQYEVEGSTEREKETGSSAIGFTVTESTERTGNEKSASVWDGSSGRQGK